MLIGNHSLKNLIGEARSAAISVHTNPRNHEHNWYPFWGLFVLMLMDNIVHRSTLAAQFPLWRFADKLEDPIEEGSDDPIEDEDPMGVESDEESSYCSHENMDVDISFSSGSGTTLDETRQRLTDFTILMWDTYSSDKKDRLSERKDKDDDYDNTKSNDKISPPTESQIQDTIKEYVPVLVEIKKYPSRALNGELWRVEFDNGMTKARKDVVTQACFLFNSDRWKAQESVLLIAAVGDYWEFSAMERKQKPGNAGKEDDAEWSPKPEEIQEIAQKKLDWSGIAKYGSVRSEYHEAQVIGWVNAEYPNP